MLTPSKVDTNSLFITEQLNLLGIQVAFKSIVGDDRGDLDAALERERVGAGRHVLQAFAINRLGQFAPGDACHDMDALCVQLRGNVCGPQERLAKRFLRIGHGGAEVVETAAEGQQHLLRGFANDKAARADKTPATSMVVPHLAPPYWPFAAKRAPLVLIPRAQAASAQYCSLLNSLCGSARLAPTVTQGSPQRKLASRQESDKDPLQDVAAHRVSHHRPELAVGARHLGLTTKDASWEALET